MHLEEYFWYFKDALSHKFCDEVIKYGNSQREEIGYIGDITGIVIQIQFHTMIKKMSKDLEK